MLEFYIQILFGRLKSTWARSKNDKDCVEHYKTQESW